MPDGSGNSTPEIDIHTPKGSESSGIAGIKKRISGMAASNVPLKPGTDSYSAEDAATASGIQSKHYDRIAEQVAIGNLTPTLRRELGDPTDEAIGKFSEDYHDNRAKKIHLSDLSDEAKSYDIAIGARNDGDATPHQLDIIKRYERKQEILAAQKSRVAQDKQLAELNELRAQIRAESTKSFGSKIRRFIGRGSEAPKEESY